MEVAGRSAWAARRSGLPLATGVDDSAGVSVDLARRLARSGSVSGAAIDEALRRWANRGESFLAVLTEREPRVESVLLRAAERANVPTIRRVVVAEDVFREIPYGMCDRLLSVPVRRDPLTRTVDVATADPLDPHIASEFGYQLGAPIRVVQASVSDLVAALRAVVRAVPISERTPAFGTAIARPERVVPPFHRVMSEPRAPSETGSAKPSATYDEGAYPRPPSETAIPLVRRTLDRQSLLPKPASPPASTPDEAAQDESALSAIMRAGSADEVVQHLIAGLGLVAARVLVLASRGHDFIGRAASDSVEQATVGSLRIPADRPSVVLTACESGYYLGELPQTPVHAALAVALGQPNGEVLVQVVHVGARVALVTFCTLALESARATRRAEKMVKAAGESIERILLDRKLRG